MSESQSTEVESAEVPLHEWGCVEPHGDSPTSEVRWADGHLDQIPSACYEQGIAIDQALIGSEVRSHNMGLSWDEGMEGRMTLNRISADLFVIVAGDDSERGGDGQPCPDYETVSITALRGDEKAVLRRWHSDVDAAIERRNQDAQAESEYEASLAFPPNTDLSGKDLAGSSLTNAWFVELNMAETNLDGSDLAGTAFRRGSLKGASLVGANLRDASFQLMDLTGCNLSEADLTGVRASSCRGMPGKLPLGWVCVGGTLVGHGADVWLANLAHADFSDMDLRGVVFTDCSLSGAQFRGANLTNAKMPGSGADSADFSGTVLTGADLSACSFRDAIFREANLRHSVAQLVDVSGMEEAMEADPDGDYDEEAIEMRGAEFIDVDFSGANLDGVRWSDADLTGAHGTGILGSPAELPADWSLVDGQLLRN